MPSPPAATQANTIVTVYRWLWRDYLRSRAGYIALAVILMAIEGAMLGLLSWMVRPVFDELFVSANRGAIAWVAGGVFALFMVRAVASFGQKVLLIWVGQSVIADIQGDLVAHLMRLDLSYFQTNPPGSLIERVRGDTQAINRLWSSVLVAFGRDVIALASLLTVAISIDWLWTLVAAAGVPLMLMPVIGLHRRVRPLAHAAREQAARITLRLDEVFHGVATIKLNEAETAEDARLRKTVGGFVRRSMRAEAAQAGIPSLMDVVAGLGFLGVLTYGGWQIVEGHKSVGEFMSFFTAMALVFEPLRRLGNVAGAWQSALASVDRLRAILAAAPGIASPARPLPRDAIGQRPRVTLADVAVAYGDQPALGGVSFTLEPGQTTALVGASGAGKSTVFNLLTRLVDPDSGRVDVDGKDARDLSLGHLRGLFAVVTQDSALFDETIRTNILLGRPGASAGDLAAACRDAHVSDFTDRLAEGLDTEVGPRGSALSGGQRQRVAIARALLRDAPILLLDEPTSALDAASEQIVQEALGRLARDRTVLVIAHRLATILDADKIVVLDAGRVVDQGTHAELLERGGVYANLYALQFREEGGAE